MLCDHLKIQIFFKQISVLLFDFFLTRVVKQFSFNVLLTNVTAPFIGSLISQLIREYQHEHKPASWQIHPRSDPLDVSPSTLSIQSSLRIFPLLSRIYTFGSMRIDLTVRRRTAQAHYAKRTKMLLTQCLDSLWQANSFNPQRDSNPSPNDKSVNKAIKAEQEPLLSPTKIP